MPYAISCWFLASVILLSGYRAGYQCDAQYRKLNAPKKLHFSRVPLKYKWLFRFSWEFGTEVLTIAYVIEIAAIVTSSFQIILGVLLIIWPSSYYVYIFSILTFFVYGGILICSALIGCISIKDRANPNNLLVHRCWYCEVEKNVLGRVSMRTVLILHEQTNSEGTRIFKIRCGAWFPREFDAISESKNYFKEGEKVLALYKSDYPYFVLLSSTPQNH